MSRFVDPKIEVVVASCGGVGTTFLIEFLGKYKRTNHRENQDKLKHATIPPVSFNPKIKMIYVWGDPVDSVISIFRRDFQQHLSMHLQIHNRLMYAVLKNNSSIDDYINRGVDRFLFKKNYINWRNKHLIHPTLFIRYESIWRYLNEIFDFLDISKNEIKNFPKQTERNANFPHLKPENKERLQEFYKYDTDFFNSLPEIEVCYPTPWAKKIYFLKKNFWLASIWGVFDVFKASMRRLLPNTYKKIQLSIIKMFSKG